MENRCSGSAVTQSLRCLRQSLCARADAGMVPRFPDRVVDVSVGWLKRRSQTGLGFMGLALLGLVGCAHYMAAPQPGFSLFYLVPILLVAGGIGRTAGLVMAVACAAVWLAVEWLMPAGFSLPFRPCCEAVVVLGVFAVTAWLGSVVRTFHDELEACVRDRTAAWSTEAAVRREVETRLRELEAKVLEISEREKRRLGEDLHDGLSQELVGLALAAQLVGQKLRDSRPVRAEQVQDLVDGLNRAAARTRGLARGLYPLQLEREGLTSALRDFCGETQRTFQIPCQFLCDSRVELTGPRPAREIYRIAQEAVRNALKHAHPRRIRVLLSQGNPPDRWCAATAGSPAAEPCNVCLQSRRVTLCVADDGVGFSPENQFRGLGLAIMSCRANLLGATLRIVSRPADGTRVICTLPIKTP